MKMEETKYENNVVCVVDEHPFQTPFNRKKFKSDRDKEHNNEPSETIPDDAMSVRELLERHRKGLPLSGHKVPVYDGDDDELPDPRTLDLAELQDYRDMFTKEIHDIRSKHKQNEATRKELEYKEKLRKEWQEELDAKLKEKTPA